MQTVAGRLVEPSPESGCGRLLAALREGPKSAAQLYALGLITHSRAAELRSRYGINVVCEQIPGESGAHAFVYRLLEEPQSGSVAESGETTRPGHEDYPAHGGCGSSNSGSSAPAVSAARTEGPEAAPVPPDSCEQLELLGSGSRAGAYR